MQENTWCSVYKFKFMCIQVNFLKSELKLIQMSTDIKITCKATAMVDCLPEDNNIYNNTDSVVMSHNIPGTWLPNKHNCTQTLLKSKYTSWD